MKPPLHASARTPERDRAEDLAELHALVDELERRLEAGGSERDPWGLAAVLKERLLALRTELAQEPGSDELRTRHRDPIRAMYRAVAVLQTGSEWHSFPGSLSHPIETLTPLSYVAGVNDYQRGYLPWLRPYEQHFSGASQPHLQGRGLLFSSGMGAIQCILQSVLGRCARLVLGRRVYYETQSLLVFGGLCDRLSPLDEAQADPELLARTLDGADAIFMDTVTLDPHALRLDFERLYRAIVATGRTGVELIVDNTVPGPALTIPPPPPGVRLFVVESLLKNYQAGMDLAACGMLIVVGSGDREADEALVHDLEVLRGANGTNITPINARMLPWLSRGLILSRLARQVDNAAILAEALRPHGEVAEVGYAGLLFVTHPEAEALVSIVERLALARRVALLQGTSFGFDTTRIALVPGSDRQLRIACGMEHQAAAIRLARLVRDALVVVRSPELEGRCEPLKRFFAEYPRTEPRPEELQALQRYLEDFDRLVTRLAESA